MDISICIASYRGAERLRRLFASMDSEFGVSLDSTCEISVWDDGSPMVDYEKLVAVSKEFPRLAIKVHCGKTNRGWISSVNALVPLSSGKIVLLLDDDVLFPAGLLSVLRKLMETIDNVGVLSWRSQGNGPGQSKVARPGFLQASTELAGYCMAFKRSVWDEVQGLDSSFKVYCSDSDFALRATLAGHPSYRVWWPLIPHEEHGCFKDAPELNRGEIAHRDLNNYLKKWNATGDTMELRALAKLADV